MTMRPQGNKLKSGWRTATIALLALSFGVTAPVHFADAQERLHARVAELDIECHEEPFEYWKKQPGRKR